MNSSYDLNSKFPPILDLVLSFFILWSISNVAHVVLGEMIHAQTPTNPLIGKTYVAHKCEGSQVGFYHMRFLQAHTKALVKAGAFEYPTPTTMSKPDFLGSADCEGYAKNALYSMKLAQVDCALCLALIRVKLHAKTCGNRLVADQDNIWKDREYQHYNYVVGKYASTDCRLVYQYFPERDNIIDSCLAPWPSKDIYP